MKQALKFASALVVALFFAGGIANAEPVNTPEPEPAGSCYGAQPICIGGNVCCRCEIGGINCVWACCR